MQKFQDFAKIVGVEIPDGLKQVNRTQDARGNWRTAVRVIVEFATSDNMTEAQRKLYERATPEQRKIMDANKLRISYSGLFNAENIIDDFKTPENGYTDEQQEKIKEKVKSIFEGIGNTAIFTLYEFNINELKEGLNCVYTDNGTKLTSRSRLFFEFFDDDEAAKRMLTASLLQRLNDQELYEVDPTADDTQKSADDFKI